MSGEHRFHRLFILRSVLTGVSGALVKVFKKGHIKLKMILF